MILDALASYIAALTGESVCITQAPLESIPCFLLDDSGDRRASHWSSGGITTGLITHDFEISYWTNLENGGSKTAAQKINTLTTALENYAGPLNDANASPNELHRICRIEIENGGGEFSEENELYGHTAIITVIYS